MNTVTKFLQIMSMSIIIMIITACSTMHTEKDKGFLLKGRIAEIDDQKISIKIAGIETASSEEKLVLTTNVINGKFEFKGKLDNLPTAIIFHFEKMNKTVMFEPLIIDKANIEVDLSIKNYPAYNLVTIDKVKASPSHNKYIAYKEDLKQRFDSKLRELSKIQYLDENVTKEEKKEAEESAERLRAKKLTYIKQLAKSSKDDLIRLFALRQLLSNSIVPTIHSEEERESLYSGLSGSLENSQLAKSIRNQSVKTVKLWLTMAKAGIGKQFRDFTQNDVNDNPIRVSSLLKPGRFLFIDFWASWCAPCRAETPDVLKAYRKYHDKGLDVLAVSLDEDKDEWLKAIQEDSVPWLNISDLQGFESPAATMLGIVAIPQTFLLDETGKIIAKNLRGDDLHNKMEELLEN